MQYREACRPAEGLRQNLHTIRLDVDLRRRWEHGGMRGLRKLIKWTAFALAIMAIAEQLRRPSEDRTWEGKVVGFVPYDFRLPTIERARSRWWNPDEPRLFVPQVFGVGWTMNFAQLVRLARGPTGVGPA